MDQVQVVLAARVVLSIPVVEWLQSEVEEGMALENAAQARAAAPGVSEEDGAARRLNVRGEVHAHEAGGVA